MKHLLIILGFLGFSAAAHAELLFEPYVGYEFGSWNGNGTSTSHTENGPEYGARLGYRSMMGFGLGAEYQGSSLSRSTSSTSDTQSGSDLGAYVEFKFPAVLRVWGTYFFSESASISSTSSGSFSGNGYKLGLGITTLPFININFEVIGRDFNKQGSTSLSSDLKDTDFALSVSIPL